MTQRIDPRLIHPNSQFFLDFIAHKATDFFAHSMTSLNQIAEARQALPSLRRRSDVCDVLLTYNKGLAASDETLASIKHLRDPQTLCVVGGQQACFLGGPLFVAYKIVSIIRTAAWMSLKLDVPVVPIFWLASEDHDFEEINHTRWLDDSSTLRTLAFEWEHHGQAIESLPITTEVRQAFDEARRKTAFQDAGDAALFSPADSDDFSSWHARIWSRLFSRHGLILIEPRVLRPLAGPFFSRALSESKAVHEALMHGASALQEHGYSVPLDPEQSGTLFTLSTAGKRRRVDYPDSAMADHSNGRSAVCYSPDAALRPLLADSLLPSVANILGPSELHYHAMLRSLYEQWDIPQPLAIPRHGATVITDLEAQLLAHAGLDISQLLDPEFKSAESVRHLVSDGLAEAFTRASERLEEALHPLKEHLSQLDPGLEARWHQTLEQAQHQVDRLQDRAMRAELARRGISVKGLSNLKPLLYPMGKPQERVLSSFSFIARFGVEWIHDMIARGEPDRFEHQLVILKDSHGSS